MTCELCEGEGMVFKGEQLYACGECEKGKKIHDDSHLKFRRDDKEYKLPMWKNGMEVWTPATPTASAEPAKPHLTGRDLASGEKEEE